MDDTNSKYSDIIDMPHHVSRKYRQMSMEARAAQFAPFAALTGFDDEISDAEKGHAETVNAEGRGSAEDLYSI